MVGHDLWFGSPSPCRILRRPSSSSGMEWIRGSSSCRAPSKSRLVPFVRDHVSRAQPYMAALIQVGGQSPALGILGHLVHTSTLTGEDVPSSVELRWRPR